MSGTEGFKYQKREVQNIQVSVKEHKNNLETSNPPIKDWKRWNHTEIGSFILSIVFKGPLKLWDSLKSNYSNFILILDACFIFKTVFFKTPYILGLTETFLAL